MKRIISCLLFLSSLSLYAQESEISFLINDGVITYIDNGVGAGFAVSFEGDSLSSEGLESTGVFIVDSSAYQIVKLPISRMYHDNIHKSKKVKKLLYSAFRYEFDYHKSGGELTNIQAENEYFLNSSEKQFLLWHYKMPESHGEDLEVLSSDSTPYLDIVFNHQMYITFVSNGHVVMINSPVATFENIEDKAQTLKKIANTVRVYAGDINVTALNNQLIHKQNRTSFSIQDSTSGLNLEIPFWLNLEEGKYPIMSSFPDINNVTNYMLLRFLPKHDFLSFEDFIGRSLKGGNVKSYQTVRNKNEQLNCYKVILRTSYGVFYCHYVYFQLKDSYAWLNFTATKKTYDKNMLRLNEFLDGITIQQD